MQQYIALIRGINVGGNNKVSMTELRTCFEKAGFSRVSTYINSGNVLFFSDNIDLPNLVKACENILLENFAVQTKVAVIPVSDLHEAVERAPAWWGKGDETKHNALFVIAPATVQEIMDEVGEAKPEYEKVEAHPLVIFWSATLKTFSRTRWSKIVSTKAYGKITIRNANTVKKLYEMTKHDAKEA